MVLLEIYEVNHIYIYNSQKQVHQKYKKDHYKKKLMRPKTSQFDSQNENQRELTYGGHKLSLD